MKFRYLLTLIVCLVPSAARAELVIDIVGAISNPVPIAFPNMTSENKEISSDGDMIRNVVVADLDRSGLFRILPTNSYIQEFTSADEKPSFIDWKAINSHALIQTAIHETDENTLRIDLRLWDIPAEQQLLAQSFSTKKSNWRRASHMIADAIYSRLTGETGYFDTRIVYVSETGPVTNRTKRLAIMDQDGESHKFLTSGASMVLSPRFAPGMQKISYMTYVDSIPKVYILDIATGRQEMVGNFPGITFSPVFSPDGKKLLMSYATDGNTEIFEVDLATKASKKLTNHPAIDTSPSYSPDGSQIVFNSDRGGTQQLYIMNADGSDVKRISFGPGRYATPNWSPRGDYIAFTKMAGGEFYIGVMYPDGTGERIIASGYLVEAPTWAPNGRVLMFFRQERKNMFGNAPIKLFTIDITGYNERMVVTPAEATNPAWSPLLK